MFIWHPVSAYYTDALKQFAACHVIRDIQEKNKNIIYSLQHVDLLASSAT